LEAFAACEVRYLVVGAHAVGAHGRPRTTKDLDLWIDGGDNLERVARALDAFGLPPAFSEAARKLGDRDGLFFGAPPNRVDLLRGIEGLRFEEARARAVRVDVGLAEPIPVIGLDDLIATKRAAGRPQDLADIDQLEKTRRG
jgi:hypothetical protein